MDSYNDIINYGGIGRVRDIKIYYLKQMLKVSINKKIYIIIKAIYKYRKINPDCEYLIDYILNFMCLYTNIKMTDKWLNLAYNKTFAIKYYRGFHKTFFKPRFMNHKLGILYV